MSTTDFLKGECQACGGRLEFPAGGVGQTIACPHCGQPAELRPMAPAPAKGGRPGPGLGIVLAAGLTLSAIVTAMVWLKDKGGQKAGAEISQSPSDGITNSPKPARPIAAQSPPPGEELPPGATLTNEFIISAGRLEKAPGSSLVYVTGNVRNVADRQRFGVKVRFTLLDAYDTVVGQATDYQSVIEPRGEWAYKAMVMESKAVAVRLGGINEDK